MDIRALPSGTFCKASECKSCYRMMRPPSECPPCALLSLRQGASYASLVTLFLALLAGKAAQLTAGDVGFVFSAKTANAARTERLRNFCERQGASCAPIGPGKWEMCHEMMRQHCTAHKLGQKPHFFVSASNGRSHVAEDSRVPKTVPYRTRVPRAAGASGIGARRVGLRRIAHCC